MLLLGQQLGPEVVTVDNDALRVEDCLLQNVCFVHGGYSLAPVLAGFIVADVDGRGLLAVLHKLVLLQSRIGLTGPLRVHCI